jgi:Xaa-Pro aminopeptidase
MHFINVEAMKMLSLEERERRIKAIREKMAERSIDVLLVASSSDLTEIGKVRYVSYWPIVLFDGYIIVPKKGEIKYFGHYGLDADLAGRHFQINETYSTPFGENPGPHIAKLIRELAPKRIGLCGTRGLGTDVYRALIENIHGIEVEDATDIIENLRMVKSLEEINWIEKAAALADFAMDHFKQILKPGKVERDLVYEVDYEIKKRGAEGAFYFIGSGKIPAITFPVFVAKRKIEQGDLVVFNIELVGEEGYCTQIIRFFSVGKPAKEILEAHVALNASLEAGRKELTDGNKMSNVANSILAVIKKSGYSIGLHMGHGQGLDMMERPFPTPDDKTELKTNMAITLHPQLVLPSGLGLFIANQYIVTGQGGRCLNKTPNEIAIV